MRDLFSIPIRKVKVMNDIYAYEYRNGIINIEGTKYCFYSMAECIKLWKNKNKEKFL